MDDNRTLKVVVDGSTKRKMAEKQSLGGRMAKLLTLLVTGHSTEAQEAGRR